jgi:hypothetical protein
MMCGDAPPLTGQSSSMLHTWRVLTCKKGAKKNTPEGLIIDKSFTPWTLLLRGILILNAVGVIAIHLRYPTEIP